MRTVPTSMTCWALLAEETLFIPGFVMIHTRIMGEAPTLTAIAALFPNFLTPSTTPTTALFCQMSRATASIAFLAEEALLVPGLIVIHIGVMAEAPSLTFEASLVMLTTGIPASPAAILRR